MRSALIAAALAAATQLVVSAQPAAFDVASVKQNLTGSGHSESHTHSASLQMTNVNLKACITLAYGVTTPQVDGPDWISSDGYDIMAKSDAPEMKDKLPLMLQTLLAERFKLKLRRETRELPVYALVVSKGGSKLKKTEAGGTTGRTISGRGTLACLGLPMSKLADLLASSRFDLGRPVLDKTGLEGFFDFNLAWTPEEITANRRDEPKRDEIKAPPPIFVALQEQLGLKLEARKAPVEVLIVEHAEKVPTDN